MSKSDLDSFLDYHKYSDFKEYRNLLPESSNMSGFQENNSGYDFFDANNILQHSNASCQHISMNNDQFCWQTNPYSADDEIASKRASNTIFKTSASQFRKCILEYVRKYSTSSWIVKKLKQTFQVYNLSLFPKLLVIVIQLDIYSQIGQIWKRKSSQTLEKKRQLMRSGKFCSERFRQLQKSIITMNVCMNQTDIVKAIDIYWGNYKQIGKYEKCKREVLDYQQQLKRLKYLHQEYISKQKMLRERAKKQFFSIKNPEELQFQNELITFSQQKYQVNIFQRVSIYFQKLPQ